MISLVGWAEACGIVLLLLLVSETHCRVCVSELLVVATLQGVSPLAGKSKHVLPPHHCAGQMHGHPLHSLQ